MTLADVFKLLIDLVLRAPLGTTLDATDRYLRPGFNEHVPVIAQKRPIDDGSISEPAVERQVIGMLGYQHLRNQRLGGDAALDDAWRHRTLPYRSARTMMQAIVRMKGYGGPSDRRLDLLVRGASKSPGP